MATQSNSNVPATNNTTQVASFPNTSATVWPSNNESHPGYIINGSDNAPGRKAFMIWLEAKPGHENAVAAFLRDINDGVNQEPGTGPWFGTRYSKTTFFIFEAFDDVDARNAHVVGPGGQNFLRKEELREMLAWPAQILKVDVMHGKFGTLFGKEVVTKSNL